MQWVDQKFTFLQCSGVFLILACLLWLLLRRLRFDTVSKGAYLTALLITFVQFYTTTVRDGVFGFDGHMAYIDYVGYSFHLPPSRNWYTAQPPLYYIAAALFRNGGAWLNLSAVESARLCSVVFYFGSMVFAGLLLRLLASPKKIYYACLLPVLFWPASAHTSVQVTNDVALCFFACGFMYFLVSWLERRDARNLAWATVYAGLAIATKGCGVLQLFVLAAAVAYVSIREGIALKPLLMQRIMLIACAVLIACFAMDFGRTFYWRLHGFSLPGWLLNRDEHYISLKTFVRNDFSVYLYFDYGRFIEAPFEYYFNDMPEAHLFWNVMLKTLLFGGFHYWHGYGVAQIVNFLFIVCLVDFLVTVAVNRKELLAERAFLAMLLMMALGIGMVMSDRIALAISYQATSRYIYFAVILLLASHGRSLSLLNQQKRHPGFVHFDLAALYLFSVFSALSLLSQFELQRIILAIKLV